MNRYVRSDIFKKQNDHGYLHVPLGIIMTPTPFFKFIFHFVWFYIKMAWYKVTNIGDGNTALTYFGSRLLALHEGGKPVETAVPSLNTTGEYYFEEDLNKKDKNAVVTAHPKVRNVLYILKLMARLPEGILTRAYFFLLYVSDCTIDMIHGLLSAPLTSQSIAPTTDQIIQFHPIPYCMHALPCVYRLTPRLAR